MSITNNKSIAILKVVNTTDHANVYPFSVTLENFDRICRFCLGTHNINPIFKMSYKEMSLQNVIADCISLKVEVDDCLPDNICTTCLTEVIRSYNFREKCMQTETILTEVCNKQCTSEPMKDNLKTKSLETVQDNCEIKQKELQHPQPIPKDEENLNQNEEDFKSVIVADNGNFSDSSIDEWKDAERKPHIRKGPQGPPFKCTLCPASFDTRIKLRDHRKEVKHSKHRNSELRNHTCSICEKKFTKGKLRQHMRVHTKEKPFVCEICSQGFSVSSNLKRHMMTHTGERPHVCEMCGKGFIQATTLHLHKRTHMAVRYDVLETTESSKDHITCEVCGRAFKRYVRYRMHLAKHNSDVDDQHKYVKPASKQTSSPEKNEEYPCDICKRVYKSKPLLKSHKLTHGEKTFLCSECGRFITKAALTSHLRIHTGEKPHTCMVCKKSFAHVGSLESHMLIHTGKKPYRCKLCTKAFTQLTHLKYHSRTHSGEKPYTCTYCNKKFALKGNLTVHIRIHTGETPYVCPVCGRGFYDSSSMKKHCKGHGTVIISDAGISSTDRKFKDCKTEKTEHEKCETDK